MYVGVSICGGDCGGDGDARGGGGWTILLHSPLELQIRTATAFAEAATTGGCDGNNEGDYGGNVMVTTNITTSS